MNMKKEVMHFLFFFFCMSSRLVIIFLHENVRFIGLVGRVFADGPGDLGSIPGRVTPKTFKMVLDTSLLNTQHYKVHIKGKMEQSWERSSALPYTSVYLLLKRKTSGLPRLIRLNHISRMSLQKHADLGYKTFLHSALLLVPYFPSTIFVSRIWTFFFHQKTFRSKGKVENALF